MVCGQLYHTTTRVVLWTDPGGYDAYRVERRFAPLDQSGWRATQSSGQAPSLRNPNRYGMRVKGLSKEEIERDTRGRLGPSAAAKKSWTSSSSTSTPEEPASAAFRSCTMCVG